MPSSKDYLASPQEMEIYGLDLINLKREKGDWVLSTAESYRRAFEHFVKFYQDAHAEGFDSSRAILNDWLSRSKALNDNTNNYTAIGKLLVTLVDVLEVLRNIDVSP